MLGQLGAHSLTMRTFWTLQMTVFWGDSATRPQSTVWTWNCLALLQQKQASCWKEYKGECTQRVQEAGLCFGCNRVEELVMWLSDDKWGFKMQWTSRRFVFVFFFNVVVVVLVVCFSFYMNIFKISLQEEFVWSIHIILLVAPKSWWSVRMEASL